MRAVPLLASSLWLVATAAAAEPPAPAELPDALRSWSGWVLHGREGERCPLLATGGNEQRPCVWPGTLELALVDDGGTFTQAVTVHAQALVALPGDPKRWPLDVKVDGRPAPVVPGGGGPVVLLSPGEHVVTGRFAWDSLPEALQVPPSTGLLRLTLRGTPQDFPNRDEAGRLWLQKAAAEADGEHALELVVHRQLVDEVPLLVVTRLELQSSGKNREELLARALPSGLVPMALSSPIPARLEPDGRLRVQVRPGKFTIELTARHEGPVAKLSLDTPVGPWAEEELWVFAARPSLRQVVVEGVPGIDPAQSTLPAAWRSLPAYRVRPGEAMQLTEKLRGDADPAPDRLSLSRALWLDFDGKGFTIQDELTGTLSRSWRLSMNGPIELGRVAVSGQDLFLTRLDASGPAGVEVRQGQVQVSADSRLVGDPSSIPAIGWAHDFQQVHATLHLPPGWRLFSAFGPDDVPGTWMKRWTLLDLFLLLITALAVGKLFGPRAGVLALVTLGLTIPEEDAPQWAWLVVLALEALARVLPEGWPRKLARIARFASWLALVAIALPFSIQQIRQAMYPALENEWQTMGEGTPGWGNALQTPGARAPPPPPMQAKDAEIADAFAEAEEPAPMEQQAIDGRLNEDSKAFGGIASSLSRSNAPAKSKVGYKKGGQYRYEYDARTVVQTGPGLPRWSWNQVALRFSGPVEQEARIRLWLLSPRVNLVLGFLRVLLLSLLALVLLAFPGDVWPPALRRLFSRATTAAAAALLLAVSAPASAAEVPSAELLTELQRRLLERPACHPSCAAVSRLFVDADEGVLRLRLSASILAETAIPLPGGAQSWTPATVRVNDKPASALLRAPDGQLWLALPPGTHELLLEGPLPPREVVQLPLPLRPHRVEAKVRGWTLDGVHEDGLADENLQLTRQRGEGASADGALQPGQLPPFVRIERELTLGLTWEVQTSVTRLTPPGTAIVLEVPLLPGESVTTADVRVQAGRALVSMAPNATEMRWSSALEIRDETRLTSPSGLPWSESWRLVAGPMWHVTWEGLPMIHDAADGGDRVPEWRPWPGETLTLRAGKPEGLAGQTITIDRSELTLSPGARSTDATLKLTLRSSRGGQHPITLPPGATLQSASIDGRPQPLRLEGAVVALPIVPGTQRVELVFRLPEGVRPRFTTPPVGLGLPSVNTELVVRMPAERWVLFAGGPRMGPAVLFWSLLVVLGLVTFALGRVKLTPLTTLHWGLLAIGLSQLPIPAAGLVAGWLLLLGWRGRSPDLGTVLFRLRQVALVFVTIAALVALFAAIQQGLLGQPDMQVTGNGSSQSALRWFADRSQAELPQPWVLSVPLLVYRGLMLAWALWLAWALLGWLRWGWKMFGTGGLFTPTAKLPVAVAIEDAPKGA